MSLRRWHFTHVLSCAIALMAIPFARVTVTATMAAADLSDRTGFRAWTDHTGKCNTEAVFVAFTNGNVLLKKKDGATVAVPLENLSDADQQYVHTCDLKAETKAAAGGVTGGQRGDAEIQQDNESALPPSTGSHDSYSGGRDSVVDVNETTRTEPRDSSIVRSEPRTLARTTARTAGRTSVRSFDNRGTRQVIVDGVGATPDKALKDCFRKAVEIVVGTIIDAESRVENDKLVMDRILTFSDGYVDTYEELEEPHAEGGLVRRRISATVRRDSLLLACGRAQSMSIDASGLYPEAMTKLERQRSAQALLRATLDLLPGKLLDLQVEGRPAIIKLAETSTTIAPDLIIRVDAKKYDAVQDRLIQVLKCLSKQDGTVPATTPALPPTWQAEGKQVLRRRVSWRDGPWTTGTLRTGHRLWNDPGTHHEKGRCIVRRSVRRCGTQGRNREEIVLG